MYHNLHRKQYLFMKNFRMPLRFYSWCSTRGAHGNLAQSYPAHVAPPGNREPFRVRFRACLKNHFRNLQAPLCGIFYPHSVAVARYAALIRIKSPTNWDSQLTKSLFQTRSSKNNVSLTKAPPVHKSISRFSPNPDKDP